MTDDQEIIGRLDNARSKLAEWDEDHILAHRVDYYPETWLARLDQWPSAQAAVDRSTGARRGRRTGSLDRGDLRDNSARVVQALARSAPGDARDPDLDLALIDAFVVAQVWGSGTSNGRGPRYTQAALSSPNAIQTLEHVARLVVEGATGDAYRTRLPGWGPAFVTKYLYGLALALPDPQPRALILDSRVWRGLNDRLGWSSLDATDGNRSWAARYEAYVAAMHRWAQSLDVRADAIEMLLFCPEASPRFAEATQPGHSGRPPART